MRNLCSDKIEEVSWGEDAEAMNAEGTAVMRESGGPAGARRGDCGFREGTAAGARRGGGFTRQARRPRLALPRDASDARQTRSNGDSCARVEPNGAGPSRLTWVPVLSGYETRGFRQMSLQLCIGEKMPLLTFLDTATNWSRN